MIVVLIPFGERGDLFSDLNRDRYRWMREAARSSLANMDSELFSRRIVHRSVDGSSHDARMKDGKAWCKGRGTKTAWGGIRMVDGDYVIL